MGGGLDDGLGERGCPRSPKARDQGHLQRGLGFAIETGATCPSFQVSPSPKSDLFEEFSGQVTILCVCNRTGGNTEWQLDSDLK